MPYRTDKQMLQEARDLVSRKGRINGTLLDVTPGIASARNYIKRVGSLGRLYELIGYQPSKRQQWAVRRGVGKWWRRDTD